MQIIGRTRLTHRLAWEFGWTPKQIGEIGSNELRELLAYMRAQDKHEKRKTSKKDLKTLR